MPISNIIENLKDMIVPCIVHVDRIYGPNFTSFDNANIFRFGKRLEMSLGLSAIISSFILQQSNC